MTRSRPHSRTKPTCAWSTKTSRTGQNRSHFFGVAAHLMRLILVDHARKNRAGKRGGGANKVELKEAMAASPERPGDVVALDDVLSALAAIDPRKAKIIEIDRKSVV